MATMQITVSDDEKKRIDQLLQDNSLPIRSKDNKNFDKKAIITPTINDKGELVLPADVPEDVREWVENG
ncbi:MULTISPECIES: hypothetical protein [Lactobacillus]|uniref:Uncharacterized protein n=1 Tax=Lactobacillus xujianguonis TaxID=2495899 RepID=A0A437SX15_9LACO|nr:MULTISPECIES: hypothetical protein [Lactobacillus]RVU71463.1 hypothetical protein EJK17_01820 [Lactobacillus xujianguonis]RVU73686.1 hypothetical protein EJK20_06870 [Lactobacillus xujianguonis]